MLEDKQRFKLGADSYVSNIYTFSHAFPLVLDSNLHDLNKTNPGLTLFSAELPWCYFCAEIKVLGMERNFLRIFYTNNKNYWSQDPPERGPWVGTTHQCAPPLLACPGGLSPPGGPTEPESDAIKSYFSRKKLGRKNYRDQRDEASVTSCSSSEARSGVRLGLQRGG